MKKIGVLLLLIATFSVYHLDAQDTLPKFSVNSIGNNMIIVSWTNTLPDVKQISIQRSFDSLTGFKTILTVLDPTLPQNGFSDLNATNSHMFYRLYIQQDKGMYQFSSTKRPIRDTTTLTKSSGDSTKSINPFIVNLGGFPAKDSSTTINPVTVSTKTPGFVPSIHVYTYRDGNVNINLPDDEKPKKYSIRFFDADGEFLFELKDIKDRNFKLDKANFLHAGWFKFELYEDGDLREKHKFYLEKDF